MSDIRDFLFRNRSYTSIPLALAILYFAGENPFYILGIILVIAGELLRLSSVRFAGGATRTRNVGVKIFCTSGPYAYVRNPLYLGNMIIYVGIVLIAGGSYMEILLAVTILYFFIQYGLIISLEEETLKRELGNAYQNYYNAVPRIFPRFTKWKGGNSIPPKSWISTVKTEKRTLQTLISFLLVLFIRTLIL